MPTPSQRVTDWLIAWRWPLLLAGVVAAAVAWPVAGRLSFDRSVENMFAEDDPVMGPFRRLRRAFGANEVVMAVYVDDELLHKDKRGIRRLASIADRLERVPGVASVVSLDRLLAQNEADKAVQPPDYLPLDSRLARAAIELFEGYTHGADGRTAAVACMLTAEAEAELSRWETVRDLRAVMEDLPDGLAPGMLSGEPVMVVEGFRFVEEDAGRLGFWSTVLLSIVILICFRSIRWVLIPVAVVQLTLLLAKALIVWWGLRLTMVSSMLTAIVTVVGIATVMHVIVRFGDARRAGREPRAALSHAGGLVAVAIFWACSTDAAGFASLRVARVEPVQDFGLMMALGSLLVVVSVAMLLPGLALLGGTADHPRRAWGEGLLSAQLKWLIREVESRPAVLATLLLGVAALIIAGTARLKVESDFTRNFRAKSKIVTSYVFVEEHLGGAGVWDIVVPAPENLDWEYLKRILELEDRLRTEVVLADTRHPDRPSQPGLTKVISLADMVVAGASRDLDRVPFAFVRNSLVRVGLQRMRDRLPDFYDALYGEDQGEPGRHSFRVMLRSRERQPAEQKRLLISQVTEIVREEFPPTDTTPGGEVTGYFVVLASLIDSMVRDQWTTFAVAAVAITVMMLVALRDLRLALIALIPNALPILAVMGLMGWFGLKINMGAAMIAAVSLGLSVDSSIHYLTSFQRARRAGNSVHDALTDVEQTVGRAMVFSTLALIVGFLVLLTSSFIPTVWFGGLVSLAMLGGLAGNLVVLPVLLKLLIPDRSTEGERNQSALGYSK
jgi:predicted RND superfamily exporter protein